MFKLIWLVELSEECVHLSITYHLPTDAKNLFDNLWSISSTLSSKSTELWNTLDSLETYNVHLLTCGSTHIAGFRDACTQASKIIVPFLGYLVTGGIWADEAKFVASAKCVYLLQLFADIQPVFAKFIFIMLSSSSSSLHHKIIICEVYNVTQQTASTLLDQSWETPLTDSLFNGLYIETNNL